VEADLCFISVKRQVAERFARNVRRLGGDPVEALEAVLEGASDEMESEPVLDYGL
jgi:hypothetical protein